LNDLLNGKDDEIERLTQRIMTLEDKLQGNGSPTHSLISKYTPGKSPIGQHGAVTDLENKLVDFQR